MRLNRTKGLTLSLFTSYTLSGPNYSEGLSGNTLAEQMMQQPGREQAASNVQVVSITSLIPVLLKVPQLAPGGGHVKQSHLLLIALFVLFCFHSSPFLINNTKLLSIIVLIYFLYIQICSVMTFCNRTLWYGQYTRGLRTP